MSMVLHFTLVYYVIGLHQMLSDGGLVIGIVDSYVAERGGLV